MASTSLARQFFDMVCQPGNGYGYLRSLVQSQPPTFEADWLDFKGAAQTPDGKVKHIWSKALGGFANSGGGVLVFGIDARKDSTTGIDCACGFSLSPAAFALKSRLLELHTGANDPPVLGIQVEAFTVDGNEGEGFVVALVPESPDRPHRSEHADHQYYIRAGDDFCIASVSLLRSLFYPHSRSRLVPHLRINPPDKEAYHPLTVDFMVRNMGTATAYDAFVIAQHPAHFVGVPVVPSNVAMGPRHNPYSISLKGHLHPGLESLVLRLPFNPPPQSNLENGFSSTVTVFSKDAEPVRWVFRCSYYDIVKSDLIKMADKTESVLYAAEA